MWPEPAEAAGMPLAGLGLRMSPALQRGRKQGTEPGHCMGWSQAVVPALDPRAQVRGLNTTFGNYTLNQG